MCFKVAATDNIPQKEQTYNRCAPCCPIFVASHNFTRNEYTHFICVLIQQTTFDQNTPVPEFL